MAARRALRDKLIELGFRVDISQANFVLAEVPLDFNVTAEEIYRALKAEDILVRYFATRELDDKLRITVGTRKQNERLTSALRTILDARP